jgi:hypothetical protein
MMSLLYPDWRFCQGHLLYWEGPIRPFPDNTDPLSVLVAINNGEDVYIGVGGQLTIDTPAPETDLPAELRGLEHLDRTYHLRAFYRPRRGHPQVVCFNPRIVVQRSAAEEHLYPPNPLYDGLSPICPLYPPEDRWNCETHGLAEYLDHVSIWLAVHTLYLVTGVWWGPQYTHDAATIHAELTMNVRRQCHCGSGRRYSKCCMRRDEGLVARV